METEKRIGAESARLDQIRTGGKDDGFSDWTRGQLAGAQQALYWVEGHGMIPTEAILTTAQRASLTIQD